MSTEAAHPQIISDTLKLYGDQNTQPDIFRDHTNDIVDSVYRYVKYKRPITKTLNTTGSGSELPHQGSYTAVNLPALIERDGVVIYDLSDYVHQHQTPIKTSWKLLYSSNATTQWHEAITSSLVHRALVQIIDNFKFNNNWSIDGIQQPTQECKDKALDISEKIYNQHQLFPARISPSVEEGIMLVYWNEKKSRSLNIEVYNTLELAGLVNEGKTIIMCEDIVEENDLSQLIMKYKE